MHRGKAQGWWKTGSGVVVKGKINNTVIAANHDCLKPSRDRKLPAWIDKWSKSMSVADSQSDDYITCAGNHGRGDSLTV